MNYAIIEKNIVTNIIVIAAYNAAEFPNAVKLGEIPVGIGDEYHDGKFWRDSKELLSPQAEQLVRMREYYETTQAVLPLEEGAAANGN